MKKLSLFAVVFLTYVTVSAQTELDIFRNYTIPDLSYRVTNLSLSFDGRKQLTNLDPISSPNIRRTGENELTFISMRLAPEIKLINETEEKQTFFNLSLPFHTRYDENRFDGLEVYSYGPGQYDYSQITERNIIKSAGLMPSLNFNQRTYSDDDNSKFFNLSINVSLDFDFQNYTFEEVDSESNFYKRKYYNDSKTQDYQFGLGFGYGRLRDVTPVINALRFQERLKQVNLLNEDLSVDKINTIATQFASYDSYKANYDRPAKHFWNDMEKHLNTIDVPFQSSNSYSKLYVFESLSELKFRRLEGQLLSISGNFRFTKTQVRSKERYLSSFSYSYYNSELTTEAILPGIVVEGIFSHQQSLHSQTRGKLNIESRANISGRKDFVNYHTVSGELGYDYEITDRIVFQLTNFSGFQIVNSTIGESVLSNNFNPKLSVFLEDQLSMDLNYNFIYQENSLDVKPKEIIYYTRDHRVFLGLNYFFDRALN